MYANKNTTGGGFKAADFMPHEAGRVVSLDEAMEAWA
jgi:hypothetical protein